MNSHPKGLKWTLSNVFWKKIPINLLTQLPCNIGCTYPSSRINSIYNRSRISRVNYHCINKWNEVVNNYSTLWKRFGIRVTCLRCCSNINLISSIRKTCRRVFASWLIICTCCPQHLKDGIPGSPAADIIVKVSLGIISTCPDIINSICPRIIRCRIGYVIVTIETGACKISRRIHSTIVEIEIFIWSWGANAVNQFLTPVKYCSSRIIWYWRILFRKWVLSSDWINTNWKDTTGVFVFVTRNNGPGRNNEINCSSDDVFKITCAIFSIKSYHSVIVYFAKLDLIGEIKFINDIGDSGLRNNSSRTCSPQGRVIYWNMYMSISIWWRVSTLRQLR